MSLKGRIVGGLLTYKSASRVSTRGLSSPPPSSRLKDSVCLVCIRSLTYASAYSLLVFLVGREGEPLRSGAEARSFSDLGRFDVEASGWSWMDRGESGRGEKLLNLRRSRCE